MYWIGSFQIVCVVFFFLSIHLCLCCFYYRSSLAEAAFIYWDGKEMSLLWCCVSWAICSHPTPEDSQEWEAFQVWTMWLLLQTGACQVEYKCLCGLYFHAKLLSIYILERIFYFIFLINGFIFADLGTPHDNAQAHTHWGEAICLQPVWENIPAETASGHALQALPWSQLYPHCFYLQQV